MRLNQPNLDPALVDLFNDVYLGKVVESLAALGIPKRNVKKWVDNLKRVGILLAVADDEDEAEIVRRCVAIVEQKGKAREVF